MWLFPAVSLTRNTDACRSRFEPIKGYSPYEITEKCAGGSRKKNSPSVLNGVLSKYPNISLAAVLPKLNTVLALLESVVIDEGSGAYLNLDLELTQIGLFDNLPEMDAVSWVQKESNSNSSPNKDWGYLLTGVPRKKQSHITAPEATEAELKTDFPFSFYKAQGSAHKLAEILYPKLLQTEDKFQYLSLSPEKLKAAADKINELSQSDSVLQYVLKMTPEQQADFIQAASSVGKVSELASTVISAREELDRKLEALAAAEGELKNVCTASQERLENLTERAVETIAQVDANAELAKSLINQASSNIMEGKFEEAARKYEKNASRLTGAIVVTFLALIGYWTTVLLSTSLSTEAAEMLKNPYTALYYLLPKISATGLGVWFLHYLFAERRTESHKGEIFKHKQAIASVTAGFKAQMETKEKGEDLVAKAFDKLLESRVHVEVVSPQDKALDSVVAAIAGLSSVSREFLANKLTADTSKKKGDAPNAPSKPE